MTQSDPNGKGSKSPETARLPPVLLPPTSTAAPSDLVDPRLLEDLSHELKAPLMGAYRLALRLAEDTVNSPEAHATVEKLLLMLRRVRDVNTIFEVLAQSPNAAIRRFKKPMSISEMLAIVSQCAADVSTLYPSERRNIACTIDDRSFMKFNCFLFSGDSALLTQAIYSIVDNAFKYSYPDSRIRIVLNVARDAIELEVSNTGIPLSATDVPKIGGRRWRSPEAMETIGLGISLWVASTIATAHGGSLRAIPTDAHGVTRVSIVIPTGP